MQPEIKEIIEKHGLHPSFSMSPTFTEKWGCQMIAYMLNAVLYGASLILTLHYFRSYSQIDSGPFTAQIFFVTRIWVLSPPEITRKLMYTGPVLLLAVCQIAIQRITSTQAGTTAACDILIAVILCMLLHKARSGFQRSDKIIDKLILYTINRGILTSLSHNSMSFLLRQCYCPGNPFDAIMSQTTSLQIQTFHCKILISIHQQLFKWKLLLLMTSIKPLIMKARRIPGLHGIELKCRQKAAEARCASNCSVMS
ncbi:MAG: hypothetical protein NXY57DRAFT_411529 [Lentinula lateritia]|nr:MAG: hypothetical protein NXY57DRAFT_411529 [Lentinula lateritia]